MSTHQPFKLHFQEVPSIKITSQVFSSRAVIGIGYLQAKISNSTFSNNGVPVVGRHF
jgi:hypothetical protein